MAKCILSTLGLSKTLWAEAVATTIYLINRCPSLAINFKTSQELWSGKPSYHYFRIFKCMVYAHTNNSKLESRTIKCIFIWYPEGVKGYKQ